MDDMMRSAEKGKGRCGKSQYIKYLKGKRLTRSASIKAKCYECDGMGESGKCDMDDCSLFPYSPYKAH